MGNAARKTTKSDKPCALEFLDSIAEKIKTGKTTEPSFYGDLEYLINNSEGNKSKAIANPKRIECGAPDFIVYQKNIPIGYIEAKDVGTDLDKIEKSEQLQRYFGSLSNLILTNYLEFRWYCNGELRLQVEIGKLWGKKIKYSESWEKDFETLLKNFLKSKLPTINTSKSLALRLAATTQTLTTLIANTFEYSDEDADWLNNWLTAFQQVLIKNLDKFEFADMFAQTLAYGFFAARIHHSDKVEFSRFSAAKLLPKTNPFLRKLFAEFTGVNMPDTFDWAVDEIVEILKRTDIEAIKGEFESSETFEDPIVHFYETFLKAYNPTLRETRGVYYTPSPAVRYIVESVDHLVKTQLKKADGLADDECMILDPATGTGSFLNQIQEKIHESFEGQAGMWDSYVSDNLLKRVFGFEILMAPYSVAHLKLGSQLHKTGYKFQKSERLGVFLTNTLEQSAQKAQELLFEWVSDEANSAAKIKKKDPIMVIVGNPPYSGHSANNGEWITNLMRGYDSITDSKTENYFECDGEPLGEKNSKWINDDYVKFIRFAQWRIEQTGYGILGFVTNHGFIDNPTFRGMRESLLNDFDDIYVLDLHGNSKKKETNSLGVKEENIFDIQQGVAITFMVKKKRARTGVAKVFKADLWGDKDSKYKFLNTKTIKNTKWSKIQPAAPNYYFTELDGDFSSYDKWDSLDQIFPVNSVGVVTARDKLTLHFKEKETWETVKDFAHLGKENARSKYNLGKDVRDWKIHLAQEDLKNSGMKKSNLCKILYRPFDHRFTYYTGNSKGFHCMPRGGVMKHMLSGDNVGLIATKQTRDQWGVSITNTVMGHKTYSAYDINYIFPLYLKDSIDDDLFASIGGKTPNISLSFLGKIEKSCGLKLGAKRAKGRFTAEDALGYVYGICNSTWYKDSFFDQLKRSFPRIPVTDNAKFFLEVADLGKNLIDHDLMKKLPKSKIGFPERGDNIINKLKYDSNANRVYINKEQYFSEVDQSTWEAMVGGYQVAKKWMQDRKSRKLDLNDIRDYISILTSISTRKVKELRLDRLVSSEKVSSLIKKAS